MSKKNQSEPKNDSRLVDDLIDEIKKKFADGAYIFRGESQCHDEVSSNLYRKLEKIEMSDLGVETVQKEELEYAKRYGSTQKTDDFAILTEIQHFGGKTNLLDFTTYYPIALFFACNSFPFKDGRIILLDKNGTMKDFIREPWNPCLKSRVRVQKSIFVRPPEGVIKPDFEIVIPKELKQPMLNYLKKEFKIFPEKIYPDLHGFVSGQETRWNIYEEYDSGIICLEKADAADNAEEKDENYRKAVAHLTNVIQLMPTFAEAYNGLGLVYFSQGEFDNAITNFDEAIRLNPNDALAYHRLGLAYFFKGDYDNAIVNLDEAIRLNPNDALVYQRRGLTYCRKGDFEKAIADLGEAIKLDLDDPLAYYLRGYVWLHLKEWDKARSDLIDAKNMGVDIVAVFHGTYRDVATFERRNDVKLPKDIVAMLKQYPVNRFTTTQKILTAEGKYQESAAVLKLLEKFRNAGKPLREHLQEHSSRGITTGYNEAFIIECETRDVLIAEHPSSAEILKPFLMTSDIKRWQVKPQDKWLIFARHGIDIDAYPAIKKHLERYSDALKRRSGKQEWYELQTAPKDTVRFEQPKCLYPDLASATAFAFDDEGYYVGSPASLLSTNELWLLGVLNTKAVSWFYARTAPQIRGPFLKFTSRYVSQIPIPDMEQEQRALIHKIVEYILYLKKQPTTDGKDLANSSDYVMLAYFGHILDDLVYELYLPDELHQGNKYFFQPLLDEKLPQLEDIQGNKMSAFRELFEHLFHKDHPVQRNHFFLDSVQSIRIIESKT